MHKPALVSTVALMIPAFAPPAFADLTAADVWAEWKNFATYSGQTMESESEVMSGNTLSVTGVTIGSSAPDVEVTGTVARIDFTEQGDGTVAVAISPEIPMEIRGEDSDGADISTKLNISHSGGSIIVSGQPRALRHDYEFGRMDMDLVELTEGGNPVGVDFSMALQQLTGIYGFSGNAAVIRNDSNIGALAFRMDVDIPEDDADFEMTMTMTDIVSTSTGTISALDSQQNLAVALRNGQFTEGSLRHGAATFKIDSAVPDGRAVIESSAESGTLSGEMNGDGINYEGTNSGVDLSVIIPGAMIPPIELEAEEMSGEIRMPLLSDDEAQPIGLSTRLEGVTVSDTVWSMIDPMQGLPRTPANLIVEMSGLGRWFVDIIDPNLAEDIDETMEVPGEVEELTIDKLTVSVAGAELTGTGAFEFDNSAVPPVPSGTVDLNLTGANTLIDSLVNIGLLPEDQAMGARMMLGLFARPGSGTDTLTSKIELGADGSVTANGQRIR